MMNGRMWLGDTVRNKKTGDVGRIVIVGDQELYYGYELPKDPDEPLPKLIYPVPSEDIEIYEPSK